MITETSTSPKSTQVAPAHLPIPLTSFIGRAREMAEVRRLLSDSRLVTLTGSGGCGKTRLALQIAADRVESFENGVWFIDLAPLADPALVPHAVAAVLSVREQPGQPILDSLTDFLRPKNMLLVLDNCEHVIDACARLADALLRACPNLSLLATSREALGIAGETAWTVPSLSLPDARQPRPTFADLSHYEAVQLFVERAVSVQPTFKLTELNAAAVAQICQRLDGIPLAIELAAARLKVLKTAEIAARLDDRFNLLTGGSRTALPRHQTLRAAIDWSYDLLTEPERVLLRRLSVFAGGWTLEAAEAVCMDEGHSARAEDEKEFAFILHPRRSFILDVLSHLVDKSLVIVDKQGGETRYHMLETIRQYAHEKLLESGELERVQDRHLNFFLQLAEEANPRLYSAVQTEWFDRLEREHDNLRVALRWSRTAEDQAELGLRLAGALAEFWNIRGHYQEGREHLAAALSRPGTLAGTAARAKALYGAGDLAFQQSDFLAAHSLFEQSVSIYRELGPAGRPDFAEALRLLGYTATELGDYATASSEMKEALGIMRELKDVSGIGRALRALGWYTLRTGDSAQAAKYFEEALASFRQIGDRYEMSNVLSGLAEVKLRQGDSVCATALQEESLQLARELGDTWRVAASLGSLGWIALHRGDLKEAVNLLQESLMLRRDMGDRAGIAWCLEKSAEIAMIQGQRESTARGHEGLGRAARLFGAAAALRAPIGSAMDSVDVPEYERQLAIVREQLGVTAFETFWAEGQAMTLEQAIEYALEPPAPREPVATPQTPRQAAKQEFSGLTERERQVAAIIAQGESNREIAKALVVSERTVESHVTNILNKLGFTTRAQIIKWAIEKGLVRDAKRDGLTG